MLRGLQELVFCEATDTLLKALTIDNHPNFIYLFYGALGAQYYIISYFVLKMENPRAPNNKKVYCERCYLKWWKQYPFVYPKKPEKTMSTMKMCRSSLPQFAKKWYLYQWGETLSQEVRILRDCYNEVKEAGPDFDRECMFPIMSLKVKSFKALPHITSEVFRLLSPYTKNWFVFRMFFTLD